MNGLATPRAVSATLEAVRARVPLVHNITNLVVTNSTANALLAIGASPAMVEGLEEVAEFAAVADALVINLGTMSGPRAQAMRCAAEAACRASTPWVLDPVAVGAIGFRSSVAVTLLEWRPSVVRGNASEIIALARLSGAAPDTGEGARGGRGVDSLTIAYERLILALGARPRALPLAGAELRGVLALRGTLDADALQAARALAGRTGAAVVVSGATDYATDGAATVVIENGHPMMTRVTGLGCTATAIIGACLAVERDALAAAAHGMVLIGLAGEIAAAAASGPGSLQVGLLDALKRKQRQRRNTVSSSTNSRIASACRITRQRISWLERCGSPPPRTKPSTPAPSTPSTPIIAKTINRVRRGRMQREMGRGRCI